jgi:hypothetical protein
LKSLFLKIIFAVETVPQCDCHSAYQLGLNNNSVGGGAFHGLECWVPTAEGSNHKMRLDDADILTRLHCEGAVIQVQKKSLSYPYVSGNASYESKIYRYTGI